MAIKHKIKFYPVENGDNVLVKLEDLTTIIIDCQFNNCDNDNDDYTTYDVKKDLLKELNRDTYGNLYVDLFINTHPHEDHCKGFENNFYKGDPKDYKGSNRDNDEIIIGELWVTQRDFKNDLCNDGSALRREAKRRRKLFEDNSPESNKHGNRIRIIGYDDNDRVTDGLHYVPGETVNFINGKANSYLSMFIHAPFKSDLIRSSARDDENASSIVLQMQFKTGIFGEAKSRFIIAGDADHYVFEKILEKSMNNGNEDKLYWDLFLAPHHCSWSFFNDTPYDENKVPKESSLTFLNYRKTGANIIASSKKIEDKKPNPPHFKAKEQYIAKVGESKFRNTAINVSEKAPQPLVYIIDDNGFKLEKVLITAPTALLSSSTPRAGSY